MANPEKKNILSRITKLLYYIVIVFICLIAIFLIYYIIASQVNANKEDYKPKFSIYTIVSPSMTPVIKVYDVVVNLRVNNPEDIQVGDIITYISKSSTSEGMTITHRVVDIEKLSDGTYEYQTQGDNNSDPDNQLVSFNQIIGKEIFIIPYIGRIQFLIANQKGWLFILLIPVSIYTFIEIYKLIKLFGLRKRVDDIANNEEDLLEAQNREIQNDLRKQRIKNELSIKEPLFIEEPTKNPNIDHSFLENYSETIVNVKENKYNRNSTSKDIVRNSIPVPTTKEEIENYQSKSFEILDTDELTSKIKEYDDKIEELNKMITDIEKANVDQDDSLDSEPENFLKEDKIKVVKVETAKKKTNKTKTSSKPEIQPSNENPGILENIIPIDDSRLQNVVIENPDLQKEQAKKLPQTPNKVKKANLNLKPQNIKKINRTSSRRRSRKNRSLNLNPQNVKKINRTNG